MRSRNASCFPRVLTIAGDRRTPAPHSSIFLQTAGNQAFAVHCRGGTELSSDPIVNNSVSIWQRVGLSGLIAAFYVLGLLRLNDCDLFNPDSPRYVIYSQAIVNLGEYRATDMPGTPLYAWRPPGLSLLIAPMMAIRPYDVVAAKLVVLMISAALLWSMFQFARLHAGGWTALFMTAALASSPTYLVLSTEVLSEIPYTFCVITVMLILSRSMVRLDDLAASGAETKVPRHAWFEGLLMLVAIALMAFTPWLRTAGVSMVLAVGLWSLMSVRSLKWLSVAVAGVTGLGLLAWRNHLAGGENYVGSLFGRIREKGLGPVLASGVETVGYYLSMLPTLLLPGLTQDRTWHAPLGLDHLPKLGASSGLAALLAAILVLLALLGMYRRQQQGGSLAFLYFVIYGGCLIVWPWRHERFLWPLFPVFWAFVPVGFVSIMRSYRALKWEFLGAVPIIGLCSLQLASCEELVDVNRRLISDRDAFYQDQIPGFYFSDWRQAGVWLNQNTPPHARILTWHAAVGETSHRFQRRVQFETLPPEKIRQQIEAFSARYLVAPGALFGDGFPWQQLSADCAVHLNVVYHRRDVVILEVEPNRTGEISKTAYPEWLAEHLRLSDEATRRLPGRTDIAIRHASLSHEAGHTDKAIEILRHVLAKGSKSVRVCSDLGWMLFDVGQYDEAAKYLDLARRLPNAESIASQLAEGVNRAIERMHEGATSKTEVSVKRSLGRVKALMSSLKYATAEQELDQLLRAAPTNADAIMIRGTLHHRLGEIPQAKDCYQRAITLGARDAAAWLMLIKMEEAIGTEAPTRIDAGHLREQFDPTAATGHVRLATALRELGWPGKAVTILEAANQRFPDHPAIQKSLAELYRQFARPDLAKPLYEALLSINPADKSANEGMEATKRALTEPVMSRASLKP